MISLALTTVLLLSHPDPGNPKGIYQYRQSDPTIMRVFDGKQLWTVMSECAAVIIAYRDTDAPTGTHQAQNQRADNALRLAQVALADNGLGFPDSQPYIDQVFFDHYRIFRDELREDPDRIISALTECNAALSIASSILD